jgi:hypothetical protein
MSRFEALWITKEGVISVGGHPPQAEVVIEVEGVIETGTEIGTGIEIGTEIGTGIKIGTEIETEIGTGIEIVTETETEIVTEAEVGVVEAVMETNPGVPHCCQCAQLGTLQIHTPFTASRR